MAVDSPLNKFKYEIIDPVLALDEGRGGRSSSPRSFSGQAGADR